MRADLAREPALAVLEQAGQSLVWSELARSELARSELARKAPARKATRPVRWARGGERVRWAP